VLTKSEVAGARASGLLNQAVSLGFFTGDWCHNSLGSSFSGGQLVSVCCITL
jgi:hypothetical protein